MEPDTHCARCQAPAVYRCAVTGAPVCLTHARLLVAGEGARPMAPAPDHVPFVRPATPTDRPAIQALALHFWAETEVDCFGQTYDVLALPTFVAEAAGEVVGCLVYAVEGKTMTLVLFTIWPAWQGIGVGGQLLQAAIAEARAQDLDVVRVATTNDDLPALALYQRHGFRLTGLRPGLVADHHNGELPGFAGIPVRDEIQLLLLSRTVAAIPFHNPQSEIRNPQSAIHNPPGRFHVPHL